jgi:predicted ATPase
MSLGHGGQILLSDAAQLLGRAELPRGVGLLDLRTHRLKDLTEPEHVWQLTIDGLAAEFPPLHSLDAQPNNLPVQRTAFIGRERDLMEVKELVQRHNLLTLVGAGGVGKTRLALHVGAELLDRFPDGVWFADLASIGTAELVPGVVASVVGMPERKAERIEDALFEWLKHKQLLLILDNCEHVVEAAASLADAIIASAPDVRIMSTSRQALGTTGEQVMRLATLEVPESVADLDAGSVAKFGAVALFIDRASLADRSFALTDDTAPIVAEICRRLDGIPLAIELAAARIKVLSIPNLARRLNDRFKLLTGGSRTALPRQKTLVALIDWSYDLLGPQEQALFSRLGVFAGGATLEAIAAVCAEPGSDEIDTLDLLSSLVDKSLVVADVGGAHERYRMLESTRAYALEKLSAAGERERLARRHAERYRANAEAADASYGRGSAAQWFDDVVLDMDNFRAAMEWGLHQGNDPVLGATIAGSLGQLWYRGERFAEGRYWMELALARIDESAQPRIAGRLWRGLSSLYAAKQMREASEAALRLAEIAGDRRGAAMSRTHIAWAVFQTGDVEEADEISLRALADLRDLGDDHALANSLLQRGSFISTRGANGEARDYFAQALSIFTRLQNDLGAAAVLTNLAELEFRDGRPEAALRSMNHALEINRRLKIDPHGIAIDHANGVVYQVALGKLEEGRVGAVEGLDLAAASQDPFLVAISLQHAALLIVLHGRADAAARLLGYVDAQFDRLGYTRETTEQWSFEQLMTALQEHLAVAELEDLRREGAAMTEERAFDVARRGLAFGD